MMLIRSLHRSLHKRRKVWLRRRSTAARQQALFWNVENRRQKLLLEPVIPIILPDKKDGSTHNSPRILMTLAPCREKSMLWTILTQDLAKGNHLSAPITADTSRKVSAEGNHAPDTKASGTAGLLDAIFSKDFTREFRQEMPQSMFGNILSQDFTSRYQNKSPRLEFYTRQFEATRKKPPVVMKPIGELVPLGERKRVRNTPKNEIKVESVSLDDLKKKFPGAFT